MANKWKFVNVPPTGTEVWSELEVFSLFLSGCSSILNPFTCCSLEPLCNTTGGCPSRQYWCHLVENCLPVTSPCSPYHSSADGRVFTLPPRYTAVTPFYHMVADIALEIPPASEAVHITVSRCTLKLFKETPSFTAT